MKEALCVNVNGDVTGLDEITLQTLQGSVAGCVQAVNLSETVTLWCNEEGKVLGLPHNPYAQFFWDLAFGVYTDYIVGTVVFTGGTDEKGATRPLSDTEYVGIIEGVEKISELVAPKITVTELNPDFKTSFNNRRKDNK